MEIIRPPRLAPLVAFTLICLLCRAPAMARPATRTIDLLDLLRAVKVAPNTAAIATRGGFRLSGIDPAGADTRVRPGAEITALVVLGSFDGKLKPSQWIVRVQLKSEAPATPGAPAGAEAVQYTNTGARFTFRSERSILRLETLGPVRVDTKPDSPLAPHHREISAATDLLALDLYRTTRVFKRLSEEKGPTQLSSSSKPFSAAEIELQRKASPNVTFTDDELRSFAGSIPALAEFFDVIRRTPDLQDILFQVLDKPSLIDVLTHGARQSVEFNFQGGGNSAGSELFWPETGSPPLGMILVSVGVFGKPILTVALYVTPPRPPLLTNAGVMALVAFSPSKPNKFVCMRVLSAKQRP